MEIQQLRPRTSDFHQKPATSTNLQRLSVKLTQGPTADLRSGRKRLCDSRAGCPPGGHNCPRIDVSDLARPLVSSARLRSAGKPFTREMSLQLIGCMYRAGVPKSRHS